jgi:N-acetylglutamate synthase
MISIASIEHVAANALPSSITKNLDGWRLRYAYGVTRRANSVLAEKHEGSLEHKLKAVEAFYAGYNAPSRFQICSVSQPDNLTTVLENQGYQKVPGAIIQTFSLRAFQPKLDSIAVQLLNKPNHAWFSVYRTVEKAAAEKENVRTWMLEHIQPNAAFALLNVNEQPAAVGLGVFENGYTGIFNMATLEAFRGRGAASTVLSALANWGKQQGSHSCYLQVATDNLRAQNVYKSFGFTSLYEYHYLEK